MDDTMIDDWQTKIEKNTLNVGDLIYENWRHLFWIFIQDHWMMFCQDTFIFKEINTWIFCFWRYDRIKKIDKIPSDYDFKLNVKKWDWLCSCWAYYAYINDIQKVYINSIEWIKLIIQKMDINRLPWEFNFNFALWREWGKIEKSPREIYDEKKKQKEIIKKLSKEETIKFICENINNEINDNYFENIIYEYHWHFIYENLIIIYWHEEILLLDINKKEIVINCLTR